MSSRTCLITAIKLLLSNVTMMEIFLLSQKWDLRGPVAVLVSKVYFKRPTPENSVAILERQLLNEHNACA